MLRPFRLLKIVKRTYFISNKIQPFHKGKQYKLNSNELSLIARSNPVIMKLDSPEFQSVFTLELMTLASFFNNYNYEIRICGGAVRDLLLGKKPKDLDFATTATPDQMKEMFEKEKVRMINTKGETHGTITARINGKENFEITTLRVDKVTDGRHAEVEFTKDWQLDASRRDLTFNSMFLGLDGTLYDYFHGYDDLLKRKVMFVGDARTRVQEDYLRILRYFRFYGRIADIPDNHNSDTMEAIRDNVKGLDKISGERIWSELSKILTGNFNSELMLKMIEIGVAPHIGLPENPNINAFQHRCDVTKNINLHPVTILTPLLNCEREWLTLNSRLKMSSFERDLGLFIIRHRNDLTITYKWCKKVTLLSKCNKVSDLQEWIKELLKYQASLSILHDYQQWQIPKFPVSGNHLKSLGVPMGKSAGVLLEKLKEHWVENDFVPSCEELLGLVPSFLNEMGFNFKPPPWH